MAAPCAFESMKVHELKQYLKANSQSTSGKKSELVRRAKGTFSLLAQKAIDDSNQPERDAELSQSDNKAKENKEYHHVASLTGWLAVEEVCLSQWPEVTDKELYNYLVYTCKKTVDLKKKNARRQLKANIFYEDGHVHILGYHHIDDDCEECYIRGLVIPSAASSDTKKYPDRSVWIRVSKVTGKVMTGYCTCTAGLEGSCNHVAALLYALVDVTDTKIKGIDASTSKTCKWKQPRKCRLSPKKAFEMPSMKNKTVDTEPLVSCVNQERFAERLRKCAPRAGWLVNFTASKEARTPHVPASLPLLCKPQFSLADHVDISTDSCKDIFLNFASQLSCSQAEAEEIEAGTRDQAKSEQWHMARAGRLTSSRFGEVCKRKPETRPDNLLKTVMNYRAPFDNEHTKWGRDHEAAARRQYFNRMQKQHNQNLSLEKCGLIVHKDLPYLATSPDGLVECEHCDPVDGVLEVKCPSSHKDLTPEEACNDKKFFCELVNGSVHLKKGYNYYYQVQGQMGISGRTWCDFVVWTLKGMSIERIAFDESHWQTMLTKLKGFYVDAVVPEIFTQRVKRGKSLFS
ncbi:hypothetical protein BaRGS_00006632 [Batillaria attramentaria]|uniref:SAP domain-containing protein n=1 Tax=Batillaria attramentaria TaxID=370345 RepID=A0ABD0LS14_9CAEN